MNKTTNTLDGIRQALREDSELIGRAKISNLTGYSYYFDGRFAEILSEAREFDLEFHTKLIENRQARIALRNELREATFQAQTQR